MRWCSGALLGAAAGLAMAGAAQAQDFSAEHWAAGVSVGTDGIGGDLKYQLSPQIVLRLRGAGLNFNHSVNSDGIHYSGKIKFGTGGGFIDWHPFSNGFLLSAGGLGGQRDVDLNGTPAANVTLAGHDYTAAQIGTVYGRAKLPAAAGFVGLGYDSTFVTHSRFGFNVLAGVQLGGQPKVRLTPTGLLATTPQLQADVASEEQRIRHDLSFTQTYPAISAGVTYRF